MEVGEIGAVLGDGYEDRQLGARRG